MKATAIFYKKADSIVRGAIMSFNRKEAVIAAIEHKETELCPYTFRYESSGDVDECLDAFYGSSQWRTKYRNYITRCNVFNDGRKPLEPEPALRTDFFGSVWRGDRRPIHLEIPVLKSPSLRGYTFPDIDLFFNDEWEKDVRKIISENPDTFNVLYSGFGLFERSWALRGFENVLMDSAAEPEFFADLIAAINQEHMSKVIDRFLELPIDGVLFGDDWGDQRGVIVGPQRWREVLKPEYAKLYDKVKKSGKYVLSHCCGSVVDIIDDMVEIGLDVLEAVQPEARGMNPYELKEKFGSKITFWGCLGSQSTIPFATTDQLRREIRKLGSVMHKGGGYIIAGAKAIQQETPIENAAAMLEEFIALGEETEL